MIADAKRTISFTRSKYCRVANITSTLHRPRRPTHTTTTAAAAGDFTSIVRSAVTYCSTLGKW